MNDILKAMRERRSIRKYTAEMPSKELVSQVVEAGMWAANGKGQQNTKFLVVKNKELRDELSRLNNKIGGYGESFDPFYGAPMVIVVFDKKGTTHYQKDGCAAMANMMLAAHSLGLGSCWVNRAKEMFELEEGRSILEDFGINPDVWEGVANLILGYPDGNMPKAPQRKSNRVIWVELHKNIEIVSRNGTQGNYLCPQIEDTLKDKTKNMIEEIIKPMPIGELLNEKFSIPSYQRGYRWRERQVYELINDIKVFIAGGAKGMYCIQPLVVKNNGEKWDVVDGQQRLTTINILLSCLGCEKYSLEYETRHGSEEYLAHIADADKAAEAKKNIDFYHMYNAYMKAQDVLPHDEEHRAEFRDVLLNKVKFIWYNIQDDDAIETFTRLNIDKISLTPSELVKALLLNRGNEGLDNIHTSNKQHEIASEWDAIENMLQKDEFWLFFHTEDWKNPTRIDYLMEIVCDQQMLGEPSEEESIGDDKARIFRYFFLYFNNKSDGAKLIDRITYAWNVIKELYSTLEEWYSDVTIYHYIGYIMYQPQINKSQKTPEHMQRTLFQLVEKWRETGMTKKKFVAHLINIVNGIIKNCGDLDRAYGDNGEQKTDCRPLLLLHNIQTVINQNNNNAEKYGQKVFNKFPFNLLKLESWDVEHIDSATTNDLEKLQDQRAWLTMNYFLANDEMKRTIKVFMSELWQQGDEDNDKERIRRFRKIVADLQPEDDTINRLDEELNEKNRIWNYALLDSGTNRGYGNAIFPMKRLSIIQKDQGMKFPVVKVDDLENPEWNGRLEKAMSAFIPPCTKQAFMKYYSTQQHDVSSWTRDDAMAYKRNIYETLSELFNNVKTNEQL